MIDYDTPDDDPIVAEVRRAREEYAAKFNFDLRLIFDDLKRREQDIVRDGPTIVAPPTQHADAAK